MKKEYEAFVENLDQLTMGKEIDIEVRSLTPGKHKYEIKRVRAILARDAGKPAGADVLRLRFGLGHPADTVCAIKIVKELP